LRALHHGHGGSAPAAQDGGIDQQHATRQFGMTGRGHQTQEAAQRVADQKGRLPRLVHLAAGEIGQLPHQVRPVVRHRVVGVMAKFSTAFTVKPRWRRLLNNTR
jgi:hypothetical protein